MFNLKRQKRNSKPVEKHSPEECSCEATPCQDCSQKVGDETVQMAMSALDVALQEKKKARKTARNVGERLLDFDLDMAIRLKKAEQS